MNDFHFYHEIKKDKYYTPLIPEKEAGLVVVLLYEQWKSGKFLANSFSEEAVKTAIERVAKDLGNSYERTPHQRFKDTNLVLQEYFLIRNEETNLYQITQYGQEFCERIKEKLMREFNPSDIEKILADLIDLLKRYIDKGDFDHWYRHHFLPQRSTIRNQVETLLKQVENSVREFRISIKADDQTFLETVRRVDDNLKMVGDYAKELKDAFFDAEEIKGIILQLSFTDLKQEIINQTTDVRIFFEDININLTVISQRIERIRPKLRQFIASINQRNFDRNTEIFLRFLLKTAQVTKDGHRKKIQLFEGIALKTIHEPESDFIVVEQGRLIPKQPMPLILPQKDPTKREKQLDKAKDVMHINKRVRFWVNEIDKQIKSKESFDFAESYFGILDNEPSYSSTIALKVSSTVFRKYTKLQNYKVTVDRKMIMQNKYPDKAIWKMNIKKENTI